MSLKSSEFISQLPLAYAYHRLVFDSAGQAVDFVFLDANPAFEEMTGLQCSAILGRKVTEVLPSIKDDSFDWIACYAGVAITGGRKTFTQYAAILERWYKVTAYSPEKAHFVTIFHDISSEMENIRRLELQKQEIEEYEEKLRQERDLLNITLRSIGDGVLTTDRNGRITSLNKVAQQLTGWLETEACGMPFAAIFRLRHNLADAAENSVEQVIRTGEPVELCSQAVILDKQHRTIPIAHSATPIKDNQGNIFGVVIVFRDVSKEREREQQITYLSYHDGLTGLYNRRLGELELERLDSRCQLPFALIMGDVNGLKITNDIFGHEEGDRLLHRISDSIHACCRNGDIVIRWGGDEILILLPGTLLETAEQLVARIQALLIQKSEGILNLSVSFGCAAKQHEADDLRQTLRIAEERMYQKKFEEGKAHREAMLNSIFSLLHLTHQDTRDHGERVLALCLQLGKKLRLSAKALHDLAVAAKLHDIGLILIGKEILEKPGSPTPEEWEKIRQHPLTGYRIALNSPELMPVADYILYHHERWDGTGYPRGLCKTAIPLPARILAVADAYDAMTRDKVYRKALRQEAAITELEKNAGTQFDPRIVKTFLSLLPQDTGTCRRPAAE